MREWFEAQLKAGLPAFAGSAVSGTLSVRQELLNELLTRWLADSQKGGQASSPPVDLAQLTPLIKSAAVRAEPGRVLVDFSIAV